MAAEEQPEVCVEDTLEALESLASGLRIPGGASPVEQVARLNHLLFVECGFCGDEEDYDDPRNSLLDQVISRRRGLPILLSILAMEVGRRVGIHLDGIAFPSHFLVSPRHVEPRFFLDPFHRGEVLREEHLVQRLSILFRGRPVSEKELAQFTAPASSRQILVRMNNNLKGSYLRRSDLEGVLRCVDRLLILDAALVGERRDRGWVLARMGRRAEAIDDLETYLLLRPESRDADMVRQHLAELDEGEK